MTRRSSSTRVPHSQSYLKTLGTDVCTVINDEGEVLAEYEKRHTYIANSKEEFMILYVNVLPIFITLSHPSKSTYAYLLANYDSETIFEIGGGLRSLIAKRIGMSTSAVANALTELKDSNLIATHGKGMYQINPRYAFKGSSSHRNRALKAIIELGCKDC